MRALAIIGKGCYTKDDMTLHYPIVVVREGKGCWAYVPSLAGVYGMGKTPARAKEDLIGAIKLYVEDCRNDGDPLPKTAARIVEVDQVAIAF